MDGVLAYQVDSGRPDRDKYVNETLREAGFVHKQEKALPEAVGKLLYDAQTGTLDLKLDLLRKRREW